MKRTMILLLAALGTLACGGEELEASLEAGTDQSDLTLERRDARMYWQAFYETPGARHPALHADRCTLGLRRRPFQVLLGGVISSGHLEIPGMRSSRLCELDRRPLLVPLVTAQRDLSLDPAPTATAIREARQAVAAFVTGVRYFEVSVNGRPVSLESWRRSGVETFGYWLPPRDAISLLPAGPARGVYPSFADGMFLVLPALDPGAHLIRVQVRMEDPRLDADATYVVDVR